MKKIRKFIWKFFGILFFVENIFIVGGITGAFSVIYVNDKDRKIWEEILNSKKVHPDENFKKDYKSYSIK